MHEMGGNTIELSRGIMAKRMISYGFPTKVAKEVASQTQESFTDFPEYDLTSRIYPHKIAFSNTQCDAQCVDGTRCIRTTTGPDSKRCWQHC